MMQIGLSLLGIVALTVGLIVMGAAAVLYWYGAVIVGLAGYTWERITGGRHG